jgi:hypothetical protein
MAITPGLKEATMRSEIEITGEVTIRDGRAVMREDFTVETVATEYAAYERVKALHNPRPLAITQIYSGNGISTLFVPDTDGVVWVYTLRNWDWKQT